jgi:hypothetical protein
MNCGPVREQLPMLLYGELSFDEEEAVETHLEGCAECRAALERERVLSAAFDDVAVEPSPALLRACRAGLAERLALESAVAQAIPPAQQKQGWWDRFVDTLTMPMNMLRPAGAVALVALGFLGARMVPANMSGVGTLSLGDAGASRVRSVEPAADGRIHIVLDETRQRSVEGSMEDAAIRELLLSATKDPSDGLRAETMELLTRNPASTDVRDALIYAVRNDRNAGVRLKALDGLEAFKGDAEARSALVDVLSSDENQGMRSKAIELLVKNLDSTAQPVADRRLIGVLQELLMRETEPEILRQRSQRVLDLMNASIEVY